MSREVITAMKASTFLHHVRESFKSLGRNGWMMFASVSAVTITLLLVGVFFVIMMNLNNVGTAYYYSHGYLSEKLQDNFIQLLGFSPFIYQVSGLLILMGALIGVWGILMSVRKFLKV
jgi:cell division protein FtsX